MPHKRDILRFLLDVCFTFCSISSVGGNIEGIYIDLSLIIYFDLYDFFVVYIDIKCPKLCLILNCWSIYGILSMLFVWFLQLISHKWTPMLYHKMQGLHLIGIIHILSKYILYNIVIHSHCLTAIITYFKHSESMPNTFS